MNMNELFHKISHKVGEYAGSPWAFVISIIIIVLWIFSGPYFGYSDTWQLVINTGTTIITFLMVFLIQNMQNRDAKAMHLKLDELIHALKKADNKFIELENMSEQELNELEAKFKKIRNLKN